jgi:hypothetical protein
VKLDRTYSEDEAQKASRRTLMQPGWRDAQNRDAVERQAAKSGRDVIEVCTVVPDDEGNEREFRTPLNNSPLGAALLRHCAEACGSLSKYEQGELLPQDLLGPVQVKIGIRKDRHWPARNVIEDFRAAESSVVQLRSV